MVSCLIIAALLLGGLFFIQNVNLNRLGTDVYYTQVQGQGEKLENNASGEIYVTYEYELPAFDINGQQKTLKFTAPKQLRERAYLSLFVKEGKGVTSYQEVTREELPVKPSQQLQ